MELKTVLMKQVNGLQIQTSLDQHKYNLKLLILNSYL